MPPTDRYVPRFAAEPPQDGLPYGRWAQQLSDAFLSACKDLTDEHGDIGEPGEIAWHPDRSWNGRTYVPATSLTAEGYELFGYVSFPTRSETTADGGAAAEDEGGDGGASAAEAELGEDELELSAIADFTDETAERNPDWKLDLCDEVIGAWRGEVEAAAKMTLVWGRALVHGGAIATAELADLAVDQCVLTEQRFTLIAPDDYRGDLLEIKLFDRKGRELASESLYVEDEEAEDEGEHADQS